MQTVHDNRSRRGQPFRRTTSAILLFLLVSSIVLTPMGTVLANSWTGDAAATVIDMSFDDAPLSQVFQSLADAADLNVLIDPSVSGSVSFKLRDIAVKDAVELVARVTGYGHEIFGNTLIIGSQERLQLEPEPRTLHIEMVPVTHVSPGDAADLLARVYPEANFVADEAKGALIVQATADELKAARDFLSQYDQAHDKPLQFRNEPVESVLWTLADRAGWNLVIDGSLDGEMSALLEGMDYEEALSFVAEAGNLEHRFSDRILYVSQRAEPVEAPPMRRVAIHRLDHANAEKTGEVLAELYPDVRVSVDEDSRTVIIEGEETVLSAAASFVEELDVPRRQVIVEARLEEIDVNALSRLGVDWGDSRGVITPDQVNPLVLAWDPALLRARLDALNEDGLSTILASPKLAAIDGESAEIMIGDRIPIIMQTVDEDGRVSETLEIIEAGIKLEILAHISSDDLVTLDIDTEVSSVASMTSQDIPQIRTREMNTRVRVRDGQSLVIGGLIEESEREQMSGLPLLKDLPLLGRLFSTRTKESIQTEMVIFLIPHIVHDTPVAGVSPTGEGAAAGDAGAVHPARRPIGSVVQGPLREGHQVGTPASFGGEHDEASGGAAAGADRGAEDSSIAWLDVTGHMHGAYDFRFEKRQDNRGYLTGLYVASGDGGVAYGGNISARRYGSQIAGITPWAGLGVEYLAPPGGASSGYIVSAQAGLGTREAAPLRIELFGEYDLAEGSLLLPSDDMPSRWDGMRVGLRLGWEY